MFAATAWHWLDPAVRYQRAWRLLRPGGHLAIWSATHVFPEGGDPFFAELQEVYEEIGEGVPEDALRPRPGELPDDRDEIERTGLFEDVLVRHFDWEIAYDAEAYLRLLDTFSGHIAMQPWQRERLYGRSGRGSSSVPTGACAAAGEPSSTSPAALDSFHVSANMARGRGRGRRGNSPCGKRDVSLWSATGGRAGGWSCSSPCRSPAAGSAVPAAVAAVPDPSRTTRSTPTTSPAAS